MSEASKIFKTQLQTLGRGLLHSKFPNDFEMYMFALELVHPKTLKTINYFVFPIMPSSISIPRNFQNNIKKTQGGVIFSKNQIFQPYQIRISGTFGRNFKFILGNSYLDLISFFDSDKTNNAEFNSSYKTGYGCCKLLEKIILNSRKITQDGPFSFFAYNLAFNQKVIVEASSIEYSQDLSNNMIWNYSLTLDVIGDMTSFFNKKEIFKLGRRLTVDKIIQQQGENLKKVIEISKNNTTLKQP